MITLPSTDLLIKSSNELLHIANHYRKFNLYHIGNASKNTGDFIGRGGVMTLKDPAGDHYTGNELIYYPALTKKLRELKHYPVLSHTFKVDTKIEGVEALDYLYRRLKYKITRFEKSVALSSNKVNQFVKQFGRLRQPVVIHSYSPPDRAKAYLIINGVEWQVTGIYYNEDTKGAHYNFNLRHFLGEYANESEWVSIVEIIPNTPYLAVKLRKTYGHKGKIKWFDLNTGHEVSSKIIKKIKAE